MKELLVVVTRQRDCMVIETGSRPEAEAASAAISPDSNVKDMIRIVEAFRDFKVKPAWIASATIWLSAFAAKKFLKIR